MIDHLASISATAFVVIFVIILSVFAWKGERIASLISALNALNTPWIAVLIIVMGMIFQIICKDHGLDGDASNQIIGAGLGLITGQALRKASETNPTTPEEPAPTKK